MNETRSVPTVPDWRDLQLGSDPELLRRELLVTIRRRITAHPRSAQQVIGPSELGTPCLRRLALKLSGVTSSQASAAWRPTVGTAVHTWLADTFDAAERDNPGRWATEARVMVGTVGGREIWGSCDLYDRTTATVVDWKVVGATTLRTARRSGPSEQYRTQLHLYGRGYRNAGLPVERVAIMYLPSSGELADAVWWSEQYTEDVALQALSRADGLVAAMYAAGPEVVVPALPTAEAYCTGCPWFDPGARTPLACPGHQTLVRQQERTP